MKTTLSLMLVFAGAILSAQTPANPEDISPLLIGEKMPDASLKDVDGKEVNLSTLTGAKKTILIFYRGSWCPYCNRHLAEVSQIEDQLINLGYQIIAVSPDSPENLNVTVEKNTLKYTLLSDEKGDLIRAAGLAFQAPERYEKRLKENQGEDAELILPVPSLFILSQENDILFEYINPNYKTRISGPLVMAAANVIADSK